MIDMITAVAAIVKKKKKRQMIAAKTNIIYMSSEIKGNQA